MLEESNIENFNDATEDGCGLTNGQIAILSEAVPGFDVNSYNEKLGKKAEELLDVINTHAVFSAPAVIGAGLILLTEAMHAKSGGEMPSLFNTLGGKALAVTVTNMFYRMVQVSNQAETGKKQVNRAVLSQTKRDLAQFFQSERIDRTVLDQI